MVCGGFTVANADCADDPYPPCAVYSELCIVAVNDHDRDRDDCRDRIAVFTAGQLSAITGAAVKLFPVRSEEHTSELQSRFDLVCRLLLEKKNIPQCTTL